MVVLFFLVWMYLYHYHHGVVDQFHEGENKISAWVANSPKVMNIWYFLGIFICIVSIRKLSKFIRLLLTPPPRLPFGAG